VCRVSPFPISRTKSKSKSHCDWRSVRQSVSLGVAPHLGLITRYLLLFDCYGLVIVGAPSLTREDIANQSQSYITTDGQPASLSWNKAPSWGLRPDLCYCQTVAGFFMWGALSDERTGLSFTTAAGPGQRTHSRVRVPWRSWPYFTVSDSRLPFSSPPTTRRVTVEVFDTASTRDIDIANIY
jgi:hypothetical protein